MKNYFEFSPRGFSNETCIYAADMSIPGQKAFIDNLFWKAGSNVNMWMDKITRKEAYSKGKANLIEDLSNILTEAKR